MQENWEVEWEDYYEILQVHPSAEPEVVEAAYRRLTRKYHPDVNKDTTAPDRMKKINIAYEVLGNSDKRKRYDSEWLRRAGKAAGWQEASAVEAPKPVVDPERLQFNDVEVGEIKRASFTIRNIGGPYSRIWFSNPDSWVRVVDYESLTTSDELPLVVQIEVRGEDGGKSHIEYIRVKLDEEETQLRVVLNVRLHEEETRVRPEPKTYPKVTTGRKMAIHVVGLMSLALNPLILIWAIVWKGEQGAALIFLYPVLVGMWYRLKGKDEDREFMKGCVIGLFTNLIAVLFVFYWYWRDILKNGDYS